MVNVTDYFPIITKTGFPYLLWLRQRPDQYGSQRISDSQPNVWMPDFSSMMMGWLGFPVKAKDWAIDWNGIPVLDKKRLASDETARDILEQILDGNFLHVPLIMSSDKIVNFDGISINGDCAYFTFS